MKELHCSSFFLQYPPKCDTIGLYSILEVIIMDAKQIMKDYLGFEDLPDRIPVEGVFYDKNGSGERIPATEGLLSQKAVGIFAQTSGLL